MPFRVTERDLDMIQLEELHADNGYSDWFAERIGLSGFIFDGAQHSVAREVNGSFGETDILGIYSKDDQRCAVMIEDKISAAFTERQAARYLERGEALVAQGEVQDFRTVLVAPRQYLDVLPADAPWHVQVAVEEIASWFDRQDGRHAEWRSQALHKLLERLARSVSPDSEDVARFSREFSEYLRRRHAPALWHNPGRDKSGPWIHFPGDSDAKALWWKFSSSQMILQLGGRYVGLAERLALPPAVTLERATDHGRGSDFLVASVPPLDPSQAFEDQLDVVEAAVDAANRILQVVPQLEDALEREGDAAAMTGSKPA